MQFAGLLVEANGNGGLVLGDVGDRVDEVLVGKSAVCSLCQKSRRVSDSKEAREHRTARTKVESEMAETVAGVVNAEGGPDDTSLQV